MNSRTEILLSEKSQARLVGVHHDLVAVVCLAAEQSPVDFIVTEGLRTLDKQKALLAAGASRTLKSRHLRTTNGVCHAVDLAAMVDGEVRWDWPLYERIAMAMKSAAAELSVPLEWGGDWKQFRDGCHFQLPLSEYP